MANNLNKFAQDDFPEIEHHFTRYDIFRPQGKTFDDLGIMISNTYNVYCRIEQFIAPYNARQISTNMPYIQPREDVLREIIGKKPNLLDDRIFDSMITSTLNFCGEWGIRKQLPTPHPVTHHSAHFLPGMFSFLNVSSDKWADIIPQDYKSYRPSFIHEIHLKGIINPIYIENYRPNIQYKYLIVRPKISKSGGSSVLQWEAVLSKQSKYGFAIDNIDSPKINPRFAGVMPNSRKR